MNCIKPTIKSVVEVFRVFWLSVLLFSINLVSLNAAKNIVIPIKGDIEPSLIKFLERAIGEAEAEEPANIIFEINTFGGRVDTTYEIVDLITKIEYPTISVIEQKAISAGTLIAMSSQKIYMKEDSTIGDVAPIINSQAGPQVLGEKFQSPLRAKFRALAQKNGYPEKLSEAFVTESIEIVEITWEDDRVEVLTGTEYNDLQERELEKIKKRKTIVKKGELLTMSAREAFELGFSTKTITEIKEAVGNNLEIVYLEKKQSEKMLSYVVRYGWLLLLLGLGGIYLEVKNPGFGFYGIMALVCFGVFFLGNYIVELANYLELLLLIAGLGLLFVEVFVVPGFGFIGVGGFVLLFISTLLMMQNFTIPDNFIEFSALQSNLSQIIYVFLGSGVLFFMTFLGLPKILKKSPLVFNQKLPNQSPNKDEMENERLEEIRSLVHKTGKAITSLRPSGTIEIEGNFYDALTEGDFVLEGQLVKVVEVKGNIVYVEHSLENLENG